ncbi:MAG: transketolase family protein [Acidobacteria bacterium]|nr:transketolase family protein [Acidobacteriota bacterium]
MAVYETYSEEVATAGKPFGNALIELAETRKDIVGLSADVAKYTDIDIFRDTFPDRFFQVGMAEQNLFGITAGLARTGLVPFATTYCSFALRRAYDFIAIAIAEAELNAKIIVALPGLTTGYGATHQGIEDLALARAIPNLVVIDPCDATEIEQATKAIADYHGPVYMRILRGRVKRIFDPATHKFEIGKAQLVRQGGDLAFISTGLMTDRALQVANELQAEGIHAAILHVPTMKPFDTEAVVKIAGDLKRVITIENHTVIGGLGSAVADAICAAGLSVKFKKIGVPDRWMECGSVPYLTDKYGLSARHIAQAAREMVAR